MNQSNTIYADYQATTPLDPQVLERMLPFWKDSFGNPHSSDHIVGWNAAEAVRQSQTSVASLIGADQDEIIFTSGATEANNLALLGIARNALPSRQRILVSAIEHKCVLASARALQDREGFTVEVIPVDEYGFVDVDALKEMLDESVLLASVMAVNNEIGTIQDVSAIAATLAEWGILFHCDAAQAPCAMDLSRIAEHADLLSLSAHKFYGPQGIGALFVRRYLQSDLEPVIYGGGQQQGLRSGTLPVALCAGMAAAAELIMESGADERKRIGALRDNFTATCRMAGPESGSMDLLETACTRATQICALKAARPTTFSGHFNQSWRHRPEPPVHQDFPSRHMYCAPLGSPPMRRNPPSDSALEDSLEMKIYQRQQR